MTPSSLYPTHLPPSFYINYTNASTDRPFTTTHRSLEAITHSLNAPSTPDELWIAEIEEWQVSGATACPVAKTQRQYEKFFAGMEFMSVEEMLRKAEVEGRV